MRYLKKFNESLDIADICKEYGIVNYTINDGLVDVDGNVNISSKSLTKLPLKFGKVTGDFLCYNNQLISLEGAPESVGGDFYCINNQLASLEGAPNSVGGDFYCSDNDLVSLEGAPKSVGGDFYCYNNQLISLEGVPKSVNGFYCYNNKLVSLEGAPKSVGGVFECSYNQLVSLENCPPNIESLRCVDNPIYKYWKGLNIDDLELFLYMDINTTDPDEISEEKINYIKNR